MVENSTRRMHGALDDNNTGTRLYNLFLLIIDIIVLEVRFFASVLEEIFSIFFPPPQADVRGEIVLVTGAAHGIGQQIAYQYAQAGATVVCWDVNEKGNKGTVEEIKAQGGKAVDYVCDVTNREQINELAQKVLKEVGHVSIVVNNAGIMPCHPLLQHSEKEITTMFDINVLAHFWIIQAFLPDMIERNHGHFVALSSCAGLFGLINLVPYCGTKFAVRGYMQALAEELRRDPRNLNIKLTTIYPYMVDTGLCKKPHARFPNLLKLVKPDEAATAIIDAQRRGVEEVSIPKRYIYLDRVGRLLPRKGMRLLADFLDAGVDSDL